VLAHHVAPGDTTREGPGANPAPRRHAGFARLPDLDGLLIGPLKKVPLLKMFVPAVTSASPRLNGRPDEAGGLNGAPETS
jgi:hypothetical protein